MSEIRKATYFVLRTATKRIPEMEGREWFDRPHSCGNHGRGTRY